MENKIDIDRIHDITMWLFLITALITAVAIIYTGIISYYEMDNYILKCREAGGVPIGYRHSINCAKDGYIDIR